MRLIIRRRVATSLLVSRRSSPSISTSHRVEPAAWVSASNGCSRSVRADCTRAAPRGPAIRRPLARDVRRTVSVRRNAKRAPSTSHHPTEQHPCPKDRTPQAGRERDPYEHASARPELPFLGCLRAPGAQGLRIERSGRAVARVAHVFDALRARPPAAVFQAARAAGVAERGKADAAHWPHPNTGCFSSLVP